MKNIQDIRGLNEAVLELFNIPKDLRVTWMRVTFFPNDMPKIEIESLIDPEEYDDNGEARKILSRYELKSIDT